MASLSPRLQGFAEKAGFPHSVLQPPQDCVKLEFLLLPVEGHWQVAELHRKERCQEVRHSAQPFPFGLHSLKGCNRHALQKTDHFSCLTPFSPLTVLPDLLEFPEDETSLLAESAPYHLLSPS